MMVGSFTSVSLTPPIVAFLPSKTSTTLRKIRQAGVFCVNVLTTADQEYVSRQLAAKGGDKFADLRWGCHQPARRTLPVRSRGSTARLATSTTQVTIK